jgi:hypothetical protein
LTCSSFFVLLKGEAVRLVHCLLYTADSQNLFIIIDDNLDNFEDKPTSLVLKGFFMSNKKQKFQLEDVEVVRNPALEEFLNKSDLELVINEIEKLSNNFYGLVFLHQVYATLNNNTIVDDQVAELRKQCSKFKFFNYSVGFSNRDCEVVIVNTERYLNYFRSCVMKQQLVQSETTNLELIHKFEHFVQSVTVMSIRRTELQKLNTNKPTTNKIDNNSDIDSNIDLSFSNIEVDWLLERGFLKHHLETALYASSHSEEVFWLSHPMLGMLSKYRESAQKVILSWISQTKYKELSEKLLTRADREVSHHDVNIDIDNSTNSIDEYSGNTGGGFISNASSSIKRKTFTKSDKTTIKYRLDPITTSPLPIAYHLLDMIGKHVVCRVSASATGDHIVRLLQSSK